MYSLDIETAPTGKTSNPYALEPMRYVTGQAEITSVAVSGPDGFSVQLHLRNDSMDDLPDLLDALAGKEVVAHYAVFDVAWLIAAAGIDKVARIKWRDSALLGKWINNGQSAEAEKRSYSLKALCADYLPSHPRIREFLDVKDEYHDAGEDYEYWLNRGKLDALMTLELYKTMMSIMPEAQINGYMIEQDAIVPVANSWLVGIPLDKQGAEELKPRITKAKAAISKKLGIAETVFTSPKQLSAYLYGKLGLPPISFTKTGAASTSADDLKMLAYRLAGTKEGDIVQAVLDFKQVRTLESKFINGILDVCDYNGVSSNHSSPRMFGTYTGRFTYSSKTLKTIYRPGIATHQLPRKGPTRKLLIAPPGRMIGELDAAAQELRGIALESRDIKLIEGFNNGMDLHAAMAADIAGEGYESFNRRYHEGAEDAVNYRYAGKLLNLSCQYRIGSKSLAHKFFTTYGIVVSQSQAAAYLNLYKRRYKGVKEYWDKAIHKARQNGYAETIAGRRYEINNWSSKKWQSESSAINFPVQGFGADHKSLAIAALFKQFPEAHFMLDLHDGLFYSVPEHNGKELLLAMRDYISNLPYSDIWGAEVPIKLPFDAQLGKSFGDIKEI